MLTEVEVINPSGEILKLPLTDVTQGIIVKEINGLDPVVAAIASTTFANLDGEYFQSSRRSMRNITMKLGMEPHYGGGSVQDIRRRLYNFLLPKMPITLRFTTGDGDVRVIEGMAEDFKSPMFVKEPEVDISILCFDPDFRSLEEGHASGISRSAYGFDFPEAEAPYDGTTPTGFRLEITPRDEWPYEENITRFTLYQLRPDGIEDKMEFVLPAQTVQPWIIRVNTIPGQKSATLDDANGIRSILSGFTSDSTWLKLWPGINKFAMKDNYAVEGHSKWDLYYHNTYGGL